MMLRPGFWVSLFLVLSLCGWATSSNAQVAENIADERLKLTDQRDEALRHFDAKDSQCRRQFGVTGCITDVNRERSARLSAIKKAENLLSDRERLQRAAAQIQIVASRVQAQENRNNAAISLPLDNQPALANPAPNPANGAALQSQPPIGGVADKVTPGISIGQQRENRMVYESKQKEARNKRNKRDARLMESKPAVQGLPVSP